jgi:hypothetical protein
MPASQWRALAVHSPFMHGLLALKSDDPSVVVVNPLASQVKRVNLLNYPKQMGKIRVWISEVSDQGKSSESRTHR